LVGRPGNLQPPIWANRYVRHLRTPHPRAPKEEGGAASDEPAKPKTEAAAEDKAKPSKAAEAKTEKADEPKAKKAKRNRQGKAEA